MDMREQRRDEPTERLPRMAIFRCLTEGAMIAPTARISSQGRSAAVVLKKSVQTFFSFQPLDTNKGKCQLAKDSGWHMAIVIKRDK